ncbi:DUF4145 domain-containing protein [Niallia circulans]|uniref:DUF4145 domain-containing protein n=1 Tax=Niallia circulans TaxID=1397 RepID=UPI003D998547
MESLKKFREKVYCRRCNNKTNHGIIHDYEISGGDDEAGYFWSENYIISQCLGCDTIAFIKDYDDSTMHFSVYEEQSDSFINVDFDDIKVYPPEPVVNKKQDDYKLVEFQHLPELLETLYKQVVANFELKYYLLAAAGLRMITEGICNHLGIIDGYVIDETSKKIKVKNDGTVIRSESLNGRINGLIEKGVLTEGQTSILHIIRKIGNQTVHELNVPKRRLILSSLEIVEQTFNNIFELKKYDKISQNL